MSKKNSFIPLSVPHLSGNEWNYIKDCLDTGWVSTAGSYVDKFEKEFSSYVGTNYAIACSSGTSALHTSLLIAGVQSSNLVIVPTLTFIATINAIKYTGADPFFMDCDEHYNICANKLRTFFEEETIFQDGQCIHKKSNKKIAAVLVVHVFGNASDISWLVNFCKEKNIFLIEDAAESLGTRYNSYFENLKNKHTGTVGDIGCFSFNGNKIITSGGGGMIVTNNKKIAQKAKYLTTQAKDDETYFIHNEIGYNYRLSNIQAALGCAQLEFIEQYRNKKEEIYKYYSAEINKINGLAIANVPSWALNNYWMICLQIDADTYGENRDQILKRLEKDNVQTRPIWKLNHLQKPFLSCPSYKIERASTLYKSTLNIPCSTGIDADSLEYIVSKLKKS
ncbi:MAG: LegC family aminotransferase [Oligoflexia bacterium]|nr:LegC family aminotransferase [Oligoflexia bacterium]